MRTVWKYPVMAGRSLIEMPKGAKLLHVETQDDQPCLWALVDPHAEQEARTFDVLGTGWQFDETRRTYVGTFLLNGGELVFHVFEVTP